MIWSHTVGVVCLMSPVSLVDVIAVCCGLLLTEPP